MKRFTNLKNKAGKLIGLVAIGSLSLTTFASDYNTHWAKQPIERWQQAGIIGGYEDGTFRPNNPVTRAELAAMLSRVLGLIDTKGAKTYKDVKAEAWYAADIAKISSLSLMNDDETQFRPGDYATREEAAYLMANVYQLTPTQEEITFKDLGHISPWAKAQVMALRQNGYIQGREDNRFDPRGSLTRAEVATMLDNITHNYINAAGTYDSVKPGNVVVIAKDVILKDITITGNLYLAQGIGQGDVTLENVTVEGNTYVAEGGINVIKLKDNKLINDAVDEGGGDSTSFLDNVTGKVQLGTRQIEAQVINGKIIFDLSGLSDTERLKGFMLSAVGNLKISLNELDTDLAANTSYGITDMIGNTNTGKIQEKVSGYSDAEINFAKAFIGAQSDLSVGTARELADRVGDYIYTGTITDSAGKTETITIEIRIN